MPITTLASGDNGSTSRTTLNANFTDLDTTKADLASPTFTGTLTVPVALTGVLRADTGVMSVDTDITDLVTAADLTTAGKVEIATGAETNTGTDAGRAVSPDGLNDWTGSIQLTTSALTSVGIIASGTWQGDVVAEAYLPNAAAAAEGVVELAIASEIDTGTDATRAIPVDQFVASKRNIRWLVFNLVEAATDTAAATNIAGDFVSPIAGTILQSDTTPFYIYATNSTAGTTGTMVVDVNIGGASIFTTDLLDFDSTEKTTTTAATPPNVTTTALAVGDIITIDIDSLHTTPAKGLTVYIAVRE